MDRSAVLSQDGIYRYRLERVWDPSTPPAVFVMLNPSTADATRDDATIRRCVGFAKRFGSGGLLVVNLYGLRATDPSELTRHPDPVGPANDMHLVLALTEGAPIVCAWGVNAKPERVRRFLGFAQWHSLRALGVTKQGAPRHPLYIRAAAPLIDYPLDGGE